MAYCFILVVAAYCSTIFAAAPSAVQQSLPPGANVNFTVYLANTQDSRTSAITTTQSISSKKQTDPQLLNKMPEIKQYISQEIATLKSNAPSFSSLLWIVPTSVAASAYVYYCYQVFSMQRYLKQKSLWSYWRSDISLTQLLALPQEQLVQELLAEINRRYLNHHTITDPLTPLTLFMSAIEQEEEHLNYYIFIAQWLYYTHLNRLFPLKGSLYQQAQEQLKRLAYYKNIFSTWASAYAFKESQKRAIIVTDCDPGIRAAIKRMKHRFISLMNCHFLKERQKHSSL